jgi:signal transduction histidine kinase
MKEWFRIKFFLPGFFLFFCCVNLSAQESENEIESLLRRSTVEGYKNTVLKVMGDQAYPPYEFLNEQGQPDGFSVAVIRAALETMNIEYNITLGPWSEVMDSLRGGRIDLVMGMYKTLERDKEFDFSIPHFISSYAIFVRKGSKITSIKDIFNKTIIVQKGDLAHDFLLEKEIGNKLIVTRDAKDVLLRLSAGEGDCGITARFQSVSLIEHEGIKNIESIGPPILQRKYCIAVQEGNYSLLSELNEGLNIIKTNGIYDEIHDKWFNVYETRLFTWRDALGYLLLIGGPLLLITLISIGWTYSLKRQVTSKTLSLREELHRRETVQHQLRVNELELKFKNDRYEVVNKQLLAQNQQIKNMNEQLVLAKAKAEENDRLKSAFLANMSHEIRTPMNGIIGFCDLIQSEVSEVRRLKYVEIISDNAYRLLNLLNDILDISRIETGQIDIQHEWVGLRAMMEEWRDFYAPLAQERGLGFRFFPEPQWLDLKVLSDEKRLGQVLNNFLSNALNHTFKGTITMGYKVNGNEVKVWVRDTGTGISKDQHEKIFERFVQGKNNSKAKQSGTGLGLAIARSIVLLLGGTIGVDSIPDKGSTFWFTHPLKS